MNSTKPYNAMKGLRQTSYTNRGNHKEEKKVFLSFFTPRETKKKEGKLTLTQEERIS
ncbi:MAG: hypothetical protein K9W45_00145 [Candidatus Heimdallarchaeum aukensis]|uniref:Uncharacterized protein n=1 Tax=Candidatus Heimdallarchaeum aukensis TaxID=2876573 RepID=A0A9Y1BL62_9ARCH|nr:MAG: hypothetical protein K9W45_00135 [Candidatus Heimdallarchaeum aukensis]UJG40883.1 MAG: hypothetical protein K9W45_00145 [Candidatus Heimdallarchaeum aukensis]